MEGYAYFSSNTLIVWVGEVSVQQQNQTPVRVTLEIYTTITKWDVGTWMHTYNLDMYGTIVCFYVNLFTV